MPSITAIIGIAPRAHPYRGNSLPRTFPPIEPDNTSSTHAQQPVDSWAGTIQGLAMAERLRGHKGVAQRRRRMLRSNWLCEHCQAKGVTRKADVVDHIRPLAHGGPDTDENCRNLCNDCHLDAGAEQFGHRKRITIGLDGWPVDTGKSVRLA